MNSKGLLLILVIANFCWAIEGTKTIEPALVFEYKFDEPIVDVIFDSATMTVKEARALGMRGLEGKKVIEKVKVQYPKVVMTKKGIDTPYGNIRFLDKNFKIKQEIQLDHLTFAVWSQKYIGIDKILSRGEKAVVTSLQFCIYDTEGNKILEKKFDECRTFLITNNGYFLSFQSDEGSGNYLFFCDSKGNLLKKVMPFGYRGYFSADGVYSKSSKYILMSFLDPGVIILFDCKGNELWRKKLTGDVSTDQLAFSPDEKYIYTSGSFYSKEEDKEIDYAYLFDIDGNELPVDLKEKFFLERKAQRKKRDKDDLFCVIKGDKIQIFKEK